MITGFKHKGLARFHATGSLSGIQAAHAKKLRFILAALEAAHEPRDLDAPGLRLHGLKGDLLGHHAVWVSGNWRVTFRFVGSNVELLDYLDYH